MSEQFVQEVNPEEAFAALTDETRLRTLQVLWESDAQTMPFSELRRAVGMGDPGQFNYHLDKLVGRFVTKSDGGYRLTQAGNHVNGAIASGMYTARGSIDQIVLDHSCPISDEPLILRYDDETVRIGCDSCSSCVSSWEVPVAPSVFAGYDRDEIPEVTSKYLKTKVHQVINGFCPFCNGRMKPTVRSGNSVDEEQSSDLEDPEGQTLDPVIQFVCQRCEAGSRIALEHALLLANPVVARFHYENGISIQERFIWELSELSPNRVEFENRNPIQLNVTFRIDRSELTVIVDESFNVVYTET